MDAVTLQPRSFASYGDEILCYKNFEVIPIFRHGFRWCQSALGGSRWRKKDHDFCSIMSNRDAQSVKEPPATSLDPKFNAEFIFRTFIHQQQHQGIEN